MSTLGTADRRFPRAGGVIVPAALRELCRASRVLAVDADTDSLSADERHRLARDVVRAVSRNAHRLRQEVLLAPLPAPEIMLGALVLDDRTRCALERLRPSLAHVNAWSIERYLRLPKFGAHCLVDLLAAREEAERGADRDRSLAPPGLGLMARGVRREPLFDTRRVDDISALLVRRAPFPGADAGRLLVEAGLSGRALSLREIAAGYRSLMLPLPIRIARHGGVDVAVPAGTVGVATTVIATAVRFVADWGLATVESISDRVRALRTTSVAREIAARVVVALPSFLWIDEANGWFTLRGVRSRLATTVRQVFAVATRIRFDDLARALTKRKTRLPALPPPALDNYLRAVCDCEIVDGWVHAGAIEAAVPLSAEEKRVADALARARLAPSARRRDAEPALAASALRALLGDAPPLLPAAPGRARLVAIGASASP